MGWKGESRRHSLSRKGIKTNLPDGRRFDVSNYVARGRKQETIELRNFLDGYKTGSRVYEQEPFDDNHPYRRFFRLMMDGSYKGEDYYLRIKERVEETNGNEKKLRSIAIQISMDMLETEFPDISRSTIQKNVVDVFGKDAEKINEQLIDDLKDFAKAHEMKWAMGKASGKKWDDVTYEGSIHTILKKKGIPTDRHESDLYVKATPEAIELTKDIESREFFISNVDGERWIDLPFRNDAFWIEKERLASRTKGAK